MSNALRFSALLLLLAVSATLLNGWVLEPYRQNQLLNVVLYSETQSPPALRRELALLERDHRWDPFLRGWRHLAEARTLRKLGRHTEAREKYLEALSHKFPHHYLVELALYEWELGLQEEAKAHLRLATEIHPRLIREIDDPNLRTEIYEMIRE
jgi:tetratricopeptide (TPR) repeat protein